MKHLIKALILILSIGPLSAQTGHWTQLFPAKSPPARMSFAMSPIGENKVLLFGGQDSKGKLLSDTWIYDLNSNSWTEILSPNSPSAREDMALAFLNNKKVLLFGGSYSIGTDFLIKGDTWIFDIDSLNWFEMKPSTKPSNRYKSSATNYCQNKVALYGGNNVNIDSQIDTWLYDLDSNKWIFVSVIGDVYQMPEVEKIRDSLLLMFGGTDDNAQAQNKTLLYYPGIKTFWKELKIKNPPPVLAGHSMENIEKNKILLFGGRSINDFLNTTWIFDFSDTSWKKIESNEKPNGRYLHKIVKLAEHKVLLFSGYNDWPMFADTWLFTLESSNVKEQNILDNAVTISPNPATDYIEISVGAQQTLPLQIRIYDVFGREVNNPLTPFAKGELGTSSSQYSLLNTQYSLRIDVSDLTPGLYFVRIGERTGKFVKVD